MAPTRTKDVARLLCIANDIAVATPSYTTTPAFAPIQGFLHEVRQALGMDVAFVSRFVEGRRRFEVVSLDAPGPAAIAAGGSDALIDTYCKLIVDGELPEVLPDVADFPAAEALAITRTLNIRSYLSARVVLRDGSVFGTVCCFSHAPRPDLDQEDAKALRAVADAIAVSVQRDAALRQRSGADRGP